MKAHASPAALTLILATALPGCLFNCDEEPLLPAPTRCEAAEEWSPSRIELLSMYYDREVVTEGSWVNLVNGGQGSQMLGFHIVVYSDDVIPSCIETHVDRARGLPESGAWRYESDGMGRAEITNPVYFIEDGTAEDTVTVAIGETVVSYNITYGPEYQRPDAGTTPDP